MILPNKYLKIEDSLIGLSALIIDLIGESRYSIEKIWSIFKGEYIDGENLKIAPTYQKFIYAVELMYITGMISYNEEGEIYNENIKFKNI